MSYIWQHESWPEFTYDEAAVSTALEKLLEEKNKTDASFSILRPTSSKETKAQIIAEEITSSLKIENENIDIDSVFSSVAKHLNLKTGSPSKASAYSDNLVEMISDAFENKGPLTAERILMWQGKLFENQAGLARKICPGFRKGPEYVMKSQGKTIDIIYEAVPASQVEPDLEKLLCYVNASKDNPYVKAAMASLWFVQIHPFEDGNGRVSRAIADYVLLKDSTESLPLFCLSSSILKNNKIYYSLIERISGQAESLDITEYVVWFLDIVSEAFISSRNQLSKTMALTSFIGMLDPSEYNSRELHMLYLLASGNFRGKVTNEKWAKINKCSSTVAFRDIQHLMKMNFLVHSGDAGPKTGYFFNEDALIKE